MLDDIQGMWDAQDMRDTQAEEREQAEIAAIQITNGAGPAPPTERIVALTRAGDETKAMLLERIDTIKSVVGALQEQMIAGVHYSYGHRGASRPEKPGQRATLLQPGADFVLAAFQLRPAFTLVLREPDYTEYRCDIIHRPTGEVIDSGSGGYGAEDEPGGPKNYRRHKAMLMAQKRAKTNAARRIALLSGVFTQDLEDEWTPTTPSAPAFDPLSKGNLTPPALAWVEKASGGTRADIAAYLKDRGFKGWAGWQKSAFDLAHEVANWRVQSLGELPAGVEPPPAEDEAAEEALKDYMTREEMRAWRRDKAEAMSPTGGGFPSLGSDAGKRWREFMDSTIDREASDGP